MSAEYSGLEKHQLLSVEQAQKQYELRETGAIFASEVDRQLAEHGIATIEMPIGESDFRSLLEGYTTCIGECPDILRQTAHKVDVRYGNEAGHERKRKKFDAQGNQTQDPKNLIHFNEFAEKRWQEQFKNGPKILRDFLADGYEIHHALIGIAKTQIAELEETHPGISRPYFPGSGKDATPGSLSFMRLLRYDGYRADDASLGEVGKPHFDIAGATIQAYADAPGFWGAKDGVDGERIHYDTQPNKGYLFLGLGHEKLYGADSRLRPLWHGVDRIIPAGVTMVPERHSVILFIDCPYIDFEIRPQDTLPYLDQSTAQAKYAV